MRFLFVIGFALLANGLEAQQVVPNSGHAQQATSKSGQAPQEEQEKLKLDQEKLGEMVKLPTTSVSFGVQFSPAHGLVVQDENPNPALQIAALRKSINRKSLNRKSIKGNAADAERYYQLGALYNSARDSRRSDEAYTRAAALFRLESKSHPTNGAILAHLGDALQAVGRDNEAEQAFQQAIRVAPDEWRAWTGLASVLTGKAESILFKQAISQHRNLKNLMEDLGFALLQGMPPETAAQLREWISDSQAQAVRQLLGEARSDLDKAVASAPDNPGPYLERAGSSFVRGLLENVIRVTRGEKIPSLPEIFAPAGTLSDLWEAARLRPQDYTTTWAAVTYEILAAIARSGGTPGSDKVWNYIPESSRKQVQEGISRLERLSDSRDRHIGAGASVALGLTQFLTGSREKAIQSLHHAVTLEPSRESAWDLLIGAASEAGRTADALTFCQQRLKLRENAHNRFLCAKEYEKLGRLSETGEQIRAALKDAPADFDANLSLADLLLKRGDQASLAKAGPILEKLKNAALKQFPGDGWVDFQLSQGFYEALSGHREAAANCFHQVLLRHDDNSTARDALRLIEPLPRQPGKPEG